MLNQPHRSRPEGGSRRAWLCTRWGGPEHLALGELPPVPCPEGGVAIRVMAWGVNFADTILIAGRYQARPGFPFAPGMEVAGLVEEVGRNVSGVAIGDRVAAYVEYGGYAARVVAPQANTVPIPASVPWVEAAAFPVPYATAALALRRGAVSAGDTVLVGGAGGAVGSACVELARLAGARVIAVAGSDEKARIARACGADAVLPAATEGLTEAIGAQAPGGVNLALDPVGGGFFRAAFRALAYGGRIVTLGFASGDIPEVPVNHILVKHVGVIGSSLGLTCHEDPRTVAALWPPLAAHLAEGRIRPRVSRVMGFEELPAALRLLSGRAVGGRVVLVARPELAAGHARTGER